ncbi:hypothetical protein B0T13DRAFT_442983, partial [Neurospora crassa]
STLFAFFPASSWSLTSWTLSQRCSPCSSCSVPSFKLTTRSLVSPFFLFKGSGTSTDRPCVTVIRIFGRLEKDLEHPFIVSSIRYLSVTHIRCCKFPIQFGKCESSTTRKSFGQETGRTFPWNTTSFQRNRQIRQLKAFAALHLLFGPTNPPSLTLARCERTEK